MSYIFKKSLDLCSKCDNEYQKIFEKEESIKILKILGSTTNRKEYQKI